MIISGQDFPNIGFIVPKRIGDGERYMLTIHPPGLGPLMGHEPAHTVEVEVSASEVERIDRVAPHLITDVGERNRIALMRG